MLELSATGSCPAPAAWERYVRPTLWSSWSPQIRGVDCDDAMIAPGTTGTVRGPLVVRVPFEIEAVDHDGRRWAWRVGVGAISVRMEHGVDEVGDGSRGWVRIHLPSVVAMAYAPLARLALRRLVEA